MRISRKIAKYLALGFLLVWLIVTTVFKTQISGYFSTLWPRIAREDSSIDYYRQDQDIIFELAPGETLALPIKLETQLSRVGIYLGEQGNSSDQYVFQLEDEYGNILGKTVAALSELGRDGFLYLSNRSMIDHTETYYIKIFSDSANEGHQPLRIRVSLASDFETAPFSVSEEESEFTLILDRRYQFTSRKAMALLNFIFAAITAAVWLADTNIKWSRLCGWVKRIPWRKTVLAMIGLFAAADLVLPFFPHTDYVFQNGNRRSQNAAEQVIPLYEGIAVEQYVELDSGDFDSLGFMFATYGKVIKDGVVHIEGIDADDGSPLFLEHIKTEHIADNAYLYFQLPNPANLNGRNVLLRIWAEYAGKNNFVALYCNDNSSADMYGSIDGEEQNISLIFTFGTRAEVYRTRTAVIVTVILIVLVIGYVWKYIEFQNNLIKYFVCVPLASLLMLLPFISFLNYGKISFNGIAASLPNQSRWVVSRTYEEADWKNSRSVIKTYDLHGNVFESFERTELPADGILSNITLYFSGDSMPKNNYDIVVYWDTGSGYNDRQLYIYQYIHQGANSVSFYVPCNEIVKKILVSVGSEMSGGFAGLDEIFPLSRIEINSLPNTFRFFSGQTLFIYAVILSILAVGCLWKGLQIDERLARKLRYKKISISLVFVIIAAIYGAAFSFLVPTYQIPDEGNHLGMFFSSLRDTDLGSRIMEAIGDQGIGRVMGHQGETVDVKTYVEASKNYLDDYSLHGIPSIDVVVRPGQAVGVLLGMLLHLPAYWILQLGELGGLAAYIAMGALTLKVIPLKKSMMMMIMLLPMCMQQAGSFSYDSFTNALSFFTVAYILYLKVEAEKVSWKQLAILLLLAIGLLKGKIIYVVLLGLVLIIPLSKLELKLGSVTITGEWIKTHKRYTAVILAVLGCVGFAVVYFLFGGRNYLGMIIAYVGQFPQLVRLCVLTSMYNWKNWIKGAIALFGWFDVAVNSTFIWLVVISLFVCALIHHETNGLTETCHRGKVFSAYDLLIWYGLFFALFVVILMSMISWGFFRWQVDADLPYSVKMRLLPRIEGVQGRYLLPILPLIFIPIHTKKDVFKGLPVGFCRICYYLCVTIYPISLLLARYWGMG